MKRIVEPQSKTEERYNVTFNVRVPRPEYEEWAAFLHQYELEFGVAVRRAVRLYIDTIRRYPHTPIARDLTAPQYHTKWDGPLPPLDL